MMYHWKPDMVRFMRDASEYSSYNSELCSVLLPYIGKNSHVCDAGCGLGYLSLELAKAAGKVSSVDINPDALEVLRQNCAQRGVENIEIICGDVFDTTPREKYDAMVFCYFGDIDAIVEKAPRLCKGPVFIFKRNHDKHRFSDSGNLKNNKGFQADCRRLSEKGIGYTTVELINEFGQPFRSMEDARRFFELYRRDDSTGGITEHFAADKLCETGREDFPLYLPYLKRTGCIIINPREYCK